MIALRPGQPVVWYSVPRGGYGHGSRVLAVVVRATPKRVRIVVWNKTGDVHTRTVREDSLREPTELELSMILLASETRRVSDVVSQARVGRRG